MYIYHIFFIHSTVDGQLSCLHILTTVNNAVMNIGVYVPFQITVFVTFRYIPRSGIAGDTVVLFPFNRRNQSTEGHPSQPKNTHCQALEAYDTL